MRKNKQQLEQEIEILKHKADKWDRLGIEVEKWLPDYEKKLSYRISGTIEERFRHVIRQFETLATTSIFKAKDFLEDAKTQFKALELVVEGISSDSYNHTQKRVIANHVINLLRNMVQRINQVDFDYSNGIYERYDFFRSQSPEKVLYEKYNELKRELEHLKKEPVPPITSDDKEPLPF